MRIFHRSLVAISSATAFALLVPVVTSGEDYCKWTDENGVVHFAEKCPENVESATVATESERTESQITAAEEHTKTLLTKQAKHEESRKADVDSHQPAHEDAVDLDFIASAFAIGEEEEASEFSDFLSHNL